jgi:tRNA(Ile)-lysidine synthase
MSKENKAEGCLHEAYIHLHATLKNSGHVYIGLSGGVDSVVLLDLIYKIFQENHFDLANLSAIYINHQLQSQADNWQEFCAALCQKYKINYIPEKIQVKPEAGESIENFARKNRYDLFFKHVRPKCDLLLLAHHLDDQAETVLFRLLKGAGPKGLSGMANLYHYHDRKLLRPLLSISKQAILDYANKNHLEFIQDPSNDLINYDRNFLRNKILPELATRFGAVNQAIARSAKHYRQQQQALDYFIGQELNKIQAEHVSGYDCLDFKLFIQYPDYIQINLIRHWLELHHYQAPTEKKLSQILHQLTTAKPDKIPEIKWGENNQYVIRKFQDKIFINKKQALISNSNFDLSSKFSEIMLLNNLTIKTRIPGQKIKILNKSHSVSLKNLLQELGVPPWEREKVRLYFYEEKYLVAVEGYWVADLMQLS